MSLVGFKVKAIDILGRKYEGTVVDKYLDNKKVIIELGNCNVKNPIPAEKYIIQQDNLALIHILCSDVVEVENWFTKYDT